MNLPNTPHQKQMEPKNESHPPHQKRSAIEAMACKAINESLARMTRIDLEKAAAALMGGPNLRHLTLERIHRLMCATQAVTDICQNECRARAGGGEVLPDLLSPDLPSQFNEAMARVIPHCRRAGMKEPYIVMAATLDGTLTVRRFDDEGEMVELIAEKLPPDGQPFSIPMIGLIIDQTPKAVKFIIDHEAIRHEDGTTVEARGPHPAGSARTPQ
jgi:hypothetical protein